MFGRELYYIGLDIHKKTIAYCIKSESGNIVAEGTIRATPEELREWANGLDCSWVAGMESTLFCDWVYDVLMEFEETVKVGNNRKLKAISTAKNKNDKVDARMLADLLRADLYPECYMAPAWIRELKRVLRYRNLLVGQMVQLKNRNAGVLMQYGETYNKKALHGKKYLPELLPKLRETPESAQGLLKLGHQQIWLLKALEQQLIRDLAAHPRLKERVERLRTIPGVGVVTALTWALEIGEPERFSSQREAISYCGLCPGQCESGGKVYKRGISKQRNAHLQSVLIEAAHLAPRFNDELRAYHQRLRDRGKPANIAALEVGRKLVRILLAVDKRQEPYKAKEKTE